MAQHGKLSVPGTVTKTVGWSQTRQWLLLPQRTSQRSPACCRQANPSPRSATTTI